MRGLQTVLPSLGGPASCYSGASITYDCSYASTRFMRLSFEHGSYVTYGIRLAGGKAP